MDGVSFGCFFKISLSDLFLNSAKATTGRQCSKQQCCLSLKFPKKNRRRMEQTLSSFMIENQLSGLKKLRLCENFEKIRIDIFHIKQSCKDLILISWLLMSSEIFVKMFIISITSGMLGINNWRPYLLLKILRNNALVIIQETKVPKIVSNRKI